MSNSLQSLIVGNDGNIDIDAVYECMSKNPLKDDILLVLNDTQSKKFVHWAHYHHYGDSIWRYIIDNNNISNINSIYLISSTNSQHKKNVWIEYNSKHIEWEKQCNKLDYLLSKGAQFRRLGGDIVNIIVQWVFGTAPKHCCVDINILNSEKYKYFGFNTQRQMAACHVCHVYSNNYGWYLHELTINKMNNHLQNTKHWTSIWIAQKQLQLSKQTQ